MTEINTESTDQIVCSYCGHEEKNSQDYDDCENDEAEINCRVCDRLFFYSTETIRLYNSYSAEESYKRNMKMQERQSEYLASKAKEEPLKDRKAWFEQLANDAKSKAEEYRQKLKELENG